jgi:hypothetical protein
MNERQIFDHPEEFLAQLRRLAAIGHNWQSLEVRLPYHMGEVEEILGVPESPLRRFAVAGAVGGFLAGLALTIYAAISWPLIVGGKPVISWPPFLLIAYILTILFGSLAVFVGYLLLARLPGTRPVRGGESFENRFVIIIVDPMERP